MREDVYDAIYGATDQRDKEREMLLEEAADVLRFYANPDVYKPHPHGPAFDRRDISDSARAFLAKLEARHA